MSKSKNSGASSIIVVLVGFLIGLIIGRGFEFNCYDDEDDDEDELF